jgi:NADH dehydrogenase/NADH:ubiquinone oxidoreductase subunit G
VIKPESVICKILSYEHGLSKSRYDFKRREFDKIDIGPNIKLHMTRCILCYRCVKVAEQVCDSRVHGVLNRGDVSEISVRTLKKHWTATSVEMSLMFVQ